VRAIVCLFEQGRGGVGRFHLEDGSLHLFEVKLLRLRSFDGGAGNKLRILTLASAASFEAAHGEFVGAVDANVDFVGVEGGRKRAFGRHGGGLAVRARAVVAVKSRARAVDERGLFGRTA